MCDEIKYKLDRRCSFHQKEQILNLAARNGFKLIYNDNITEKVLMTRDFALQGLIDNTDSIIKNFSHLRERVEEEVASLIEGFESHNKMFQDGLLGYEVFLFKKVSSAHFLGLFQKIFGKWGNLWPVV